MELLFILTSIMIFTGFAAVLFIKENSDIEIKKYTISSGEKQIKKPVTIAHITDLHSSPWTPPVVIEKAVRMINMVNPDFVVITGDFVSHYREYIDICINALSKLKPKEKVFCVLGNHDHWVDPERVEYSLEEAGFDVLIDRSITIPEYNITFAGVDDPYTGHDHLNIAIKDAPPENYKVLLAHSPDIIPRAVKFNIDLVLAGHTHGGQIRFPFIGALYVPSKFGTKYSQGWFEEAKTKMYVNRGLGTIFPPVRFLCKREIAIITIT